MLPKVVRYAEQKHPVDEKQTEENIEQHPSTLHQSIAASIKSIISTGEYSAN
jgi:hypothetical protein